MKRIFALLLIAAFALVPVAEAQQSSPGAATTQTGSTGLAAQLCIQNTGTSSVATTLTIPAPGGANSVYIDYLALALAPTAAVTTVATPTLFTSTNIAGTPSFLVVQPTTGGNVAMAPAASGALAIPIKAQVGLGPTITSPVANTNFFAFQTACWHVAP